MKNPSSRVFLSTPDLAIFLATSGHSGVDRVAKNLIMELARRGIKVDLLHVAGHGPFLEDSYPNLRIVELGVSHVNSALPAVIRYLKRENPPALLSDKDRVNRVAIWARSLSGVNTRLVVRIGTTVSENLARRDLFHRWFQYYSLRHFYKKAETVIVPSRGVAKDLRKIAPKLEDRLKVIPSPVVGPHLEHLARHPVEHPWIPPDTIPVILGVGELCARKDFSTLIKAFAKVRKRKTCRLIILGEGRQRAHLSGLICDLQVDSEVSMPGFVNNPYAYMNRASLLTLSSNCEGSPVVLIEALALGVPVVSTDCPSGPREILENGRFGRLTPVGDAEVLAEAILETLESPPDTEFLKTAALRYSVEECADRYLSALGFQEEF